jgi:hypothetical protein
MSWETRTPAPLPQNFADLKKWAEALVTYLRRAPVDVAPGLVAWPIGAVFFTDSNTNPELLLGGGNWVAVAAGPPTWSWKRTS